MATLFFQRKGDFRPRTLDTQFLHFLLISFHTFAGKWEANAEAFSGEKMSLLIAAICGGPKAVEKPFTVLLFPAFLSRKEVSGTLGTISNSKVWPRKGGKMEAKSAPCILISSFTATSLEKAKTGRARLENLGFRP